MCCGVGVPNETKQKIIVHTYSTYNTAVGMPEFQFGTQKLGGISEKYLHMYVHTYICTNQAKLCTFCTFCTFCMGRKFYVPYIPVVRKYVYRLNF